VRVQGDLAAVQVELSARQVLAQLGRILISNAPNWPWCCLRQ
jgi:hypothetical protein